MHDEDYMIEPRFVYIPQWIWYMFVATIAIAWL